MILSAAPAVPTDSTRNRNIATSLFIFLITPSMIYHSGPEGPPYSKWALSYF